MTLESILNSTTAMLLLFGLIVLLLGAIFSAARLTRGNSRTGIVGVVVVLGACLLIATGLVRMTFPGLAGSAATPVLAATPPAVSAPGGAPGSAPISADNASSVSNSGAPSAGSSAPASSSGAVAPIPAAGQTGGQPTTGNFVAPSGQTAATGPAVTSVTSPTVTISTKGLTTVTTFGAAVVLLTGLILYFGERRRKGFEPSSSMGLLYAGAGVFVLVAALVVPGLPGQFAGSQVSAASLASGGAVVSARIGLATSTPTATPTQLPTQTVVPSLTPTQVETTTPLFTAIAYAASTDVSTATACSVTAQTALNLRANPSTQQQAIGKVFAGSLLQVTGQSADKKWWRVISSDGGTQVEGWVSADYVTVMSGCANATVPAAGPTLTPTRTPRPSATPIASK